MRVCFISFEYPPCILGGAGTYAQSVVKGLEDKGINVVLITRGEQNSDENRVFRVLTPDVPYWRRIFFMPRAVGMFAKLNKSAKFDLVHFNQPHMVFGKLRIPVVCTVHSTHFNEIRLKLRNLKDLTTAGAITDTVLRSPVGSVCDFLIGQTSDRIICPSPHLAKQVKSHFIMDERKICTIPNGIDLERFDSISRCDESLLKQNDLGMENYVLFVGRLTALKGVQHLIKAFKEVKEEYAHLKLVIVGSGEHESHLRNLASHTDGIVFAGYIGSRDVMKSLYMNCLALVVPSLYEGLPMVILEAMACARAVIASDTGGIPLMVRHEKNGLLAKPGDPISLKNSIRLLLEDEPLRARMGSLSRKLVETEFSIEKMITGTIGVYKSLT